MSDGGGRFSRVVTSGGGMVSSFGEGVGSVSCMFDRSPRLTSVNGGTRCLRCLSAVFRGSGMGSVICRNMMGNERTFGGVLRGKFSFGSGEG